MSNPLTFYSPGCPVGFVETRPRPATIVLAKIREEGQAFVRALRPHLVPISVLSLLFLILYLGTLRWLLNAWQFNPYYGHGPVSYTHLTLPTTERV